MSSEKINKLSNNAGMSPSDLEELQDALLPGDPEERRRLVYHWVLLRLGANTLESIINNSDGIQA
jgi:hypothetical protein